MLASISPLGERARGNRWGRTVAWYLAGSTAGGLVLGALTGTAGAGLSSLVTLTGTARAVLVGVAALGALVLELGAFGRPVPSNRRQVDETWIGRYRPWVYAGSFGFQLGLGVVTVVTTATVYLAIALAVVGGSVAGGLAIGLAFGTVRALPILVVRHAEDPAALRAVLARVQSRGLTARRVALVALVAVTAVGLAAGSA
jgi:hypothetical protein